MLKEKKRIFDNCLYDDSEFFSLFEEELSIEDVFYLSTENFSRNLHLLKKDINAILVGDPWAFPLAIILQDVLHLPVKTLGYLKPCDIPLVVFSSTLIENGRYINDRYINNFLSVVSHYHKTFYSCMWFNPYNKLTNFTILRTSKLPPFLKAFSKYAKELFRYPSLYAYYALPDYVYKDIRRFTKTWKNFKKNYFSALKEHTQENIISFIENKDIKLKIWEYLNEVLSYKFEKPKVKTVSIKVEEKLESYPSEILVILEILSRVIGKVTGENTIYLVNTPLEEKFFDSTNLIYSEVKNWGDNYILESVIRVKNEKLNKLKKALEEAILVVLETFLKVNIIKPKLEVTRGEEYSTIYLTWIIDQEFLKALGEKISYENGLKTIYRAQKYLEDFIKLFENSNIKIDRNLFEHIIKIFPIIFQKFPETLFKNKIKIKRIFDKYNLWYICVLLEKEGEHNQALVDFLLSLKGYKNIHEMLYFEEILWLPVITKRIWSHRWDEVIQINLDQPIVSGRMANYFAVTDQDGNILGYFDEVLGYYLQQAKKLSLEDVSIDRTRFSPYSFLLKVRKENP